MKRAKKITQRQAIFYQLYQKRKEAPEEYTPIYKLIGEVYCKELDLYGFVSYEVSARTSELNSMNPGLLERQMIYGKSGSSYYGYRIAQNVTADTIKDDDIKAFYFKIRSV